MRPDLLGLSVRLSLLGKAMIGLFQIGAGVLLLILGPGSVPAVAGWLTQAELLEDPADPLAGMIHDWASRFDPTAQTTYTVYLISHGVLHMAVVLALLLHIPRAYHLSLGVLWIFVAGQLWALSRHFDPVLLALTALDLVVITLVILEHRRTERP